MNLVTRVRYAAVTLHRSLAAGLALSAMAVALSMWAGAAALDVLVPLSSVARGFVIPLAVAAAIAVLWRGRARFRAVSVERAALWLEERTPSLHWALVTAVDPQYAGRNAELEQLTAGVAIEAESRRAGWRALRTPAFTVLAAGITLLLLPSGSVARVARPTPGDSLRRAVASATRDPLAAIVVTVDPPAYAGMEARTIDEPSSVRALVGSRVSVRGLLGDAAVEATLDTLRFAARSSAERWELAITMPAAATVLRLSAGARERLLALDPVPDSAPVVTLSSPPRDSILRRPTGTITLSAELSDDHGLASGTFEFIVSSGSGESFTFKSGTVGSATLTGTRGTVASHLSIDSLELHPGDMVHVRAVARDRNSISGPTLGVSETRTLRIARPDEYDSVAVDAAPPPEPEKNALSQRMLLMMAQALEKKRNRTLRPVFVNESRAIALEQSRLRKRVGEIVFQRLGENGGEEGDALDRRLDKPTNPDSVLAAAERATGANAGTALEGNEDETPIVAVNRPLLEAYNFMWSASTELEVGEPGRAIPWMQKALDRLQAARAAERIYLRGKVRAVIVDIAKVRLAGKEKGTGGARTPRPAADPGRAARLARFDALLRIAPTAPGAAADSLVLMRLEVLDRDATAAQALDAAARAVRRGGDATTAMIAARRALAGAVERREGLSLWRAP